MTSASPSLSQSSHQQRLTDAQLSSTLRLTHTLGQAFLDEDLSRHQQAAQENLKRRLARRVVKTGSSTNEGGLSDEGAAAGAGGEPGGEASEAEHGTGTDA